MRAGRRLRNFIDLQALCLDGAERLVLAAAPQPIPTPQLSSTRSPVQPVQVTQARRTIPAAAVASPGMARHAIGGPGRTRLPCRAPSANIPPAPRPSGSRRRGLTATRRRASGATALEARSATGACRAPPSPPGPGTQRRAGRSLDVCWTAPGRSSTGCSPQRSTIADLDADPRTGRRRGRLKVWGKSSRTCCAVVGLMRPEAVGARRRDPRDAEVEGVASIAWATDVWHSTRCWHGVHPRRRRLMPGARSATIVSGPGQKAATNVARCTTLLSRTRLFAGGPATWTISGDPSADPWRQDRRHGPRRRRPARPGRKRFRSGRRPVRPRDRAGAAHRRGKTLVVRGQVRARHDPRPPQNSAMPSSAAARSATACASPRLAAVTVSVPSSPGRALSLAIQMKVDARQPEHAGPRRAPMRRHRARSTGRRAG